MDFQMLFGMALKRNLADLAGPLDEGNEGEWLNLGAGNTHYPGSTSLDYPGWDGEHDDIPRMNGTVAYITAFHFFEHFTGRDAIRLLRECERVLRPGGTLTIGVPHRLGSMAYHDLDHKSFWCEDTLKTLFNTPYYDKGRETPWKFDIRFNVIAGLVERNLMVLTQLVRVP